MNTSTEEHEGEAEENGGHGARTHMFKRYVRSVFRATSSDPDLRLRSAGDLGCACLDGR
jgi:hypothetical protein